MQRYNKGRREVKFSVGDDVYVKNFPRSNAAARYTAKLAKKFRGPFVIVEFLTPVTILVRDRSTGHTFKTHVTHLKGK